MENQTNKMHPQILVIPGSFVLVSSYGGGYNGIDIWLRNAKSFDISGAEWIIAHSAGVNYLLSKPISNKQKIILINPLITKRSLFNIFIRDIHFFINEGIDKNIIVPISNWPFAFMEVLRLLKINVLEELRKIPKENVFIIRGLRDNYFCNKENADLAIKEGFTLFEVEAKHNWNQKIAEKVKEIIKISEFKETV